ISGHDGGTGASPISSIKHAGGPWELGLTETHQTLIENGLRERVILRVDGGFRSGVDVLMAAAMGADEYGFGSLAMIATGCVMARICHTNNCPVGVASQREELRARFPGVPGDLVNFFLYVAEEVRGMLAQLGYEKLDDIIGRTDLLKPRDISLVKTQHLDLNYILSNVGLPKWSSTAIRTQEVHSNGPVLDDVLLSDLEDPVRFRQTKGFPVVPSVPNALENLTTRLIQLVFSSFDMLLCMALPPCIGVVFVLNAYTPLRCWD
ncbi:hypothetical protein Golax_018739, partial [Gossypium laxum]|nr:hypothetical protein [Gossypium laxum]